ncbi:hypothetical protein B0H10DRAFT_1964105 [Mycena sp. CBHHK59/15]|nr:hypothetical protein B0H10DRAFT_1964105 [Mycena sp. CBHHK59/15]
MDSLGQNLGGWGGIEHAAGIDGSDLRHARKRLARVKNPTAKSGPRKVDTHPPHPGCNRDRGSMLTRLNHYIPFWDDIDHPQGNLKPPLLIPKFKCKRTKLRGFSRHNLRAAKPGHLAHFPVLLALVFDTSDHQLEHPFQREGKADTAPVALSVRRIYETPNVLHLNRHEKNLDNISLGHFRAVFEDVVKKHSIWQIFINETREEQNNGRQCFALTLEWMAELVVKGLDIEWNEAGGVKAIRGFRRVNGIQKKEKKVEK